jgi:excisionase family DNA binding protein
MSSLEFSVPPYSLQRWYTVEEAAIYLRCSPQTVRNLIHRQEIRASKLGAWGYRLDRKDLDHYLEVRNNTRIVITR